MVRYLGPRLRVLKRLGLTFLLGFTSKYNFNIFSSKGQKKQGKNFSGCKTSEFSIRLLEKQKLKFHYGITEKQLKKFVFKAYKNKVTRGFGLLCLIESRIDVTLFRFGFSSSIRQARQFIIHEHIFVNKFCVRNPNFTSKTGDIFFINPVSKIRSIVKNNLIINSNVNNFIFLEFNLPQALVCVFSLRALILRTLRPREVLLNVNYPLILESYF